LPTPPTPWCVKVIAKWAIKSLFEETQGMNDKYLHCIAGCEIATACGDTMASAAAGFKEQLDAYGLGTSDIYDALATMKGSECKGASGGCDCCCKEKWGFAP
jgi:hypothetical protein